MATIWHEQDGTSLPTQVKPKMTSRSAPSVDSKPNGPDVDIRPIGHSQARDTFKGPNHDGYMGRAGGTTGKLHDTV